MWIPKGVALFRGRGLFEARLLLEEINKTGINKTDVTSIRTIQDASWCVENILCN